VRIAVRLDIVETWAAELRENETKKFDDVVLFADGGWYYVGDGFHRIKAHRAAGRLTINADVREGTIDDARAFAVSANRGHRSMPLTLGDKGNAVRMALELAAKGHPAFAGKSDGAIADLVGASRQTVQDTRNDWERMQVARVATSANTQSSPPVKRAGLDGKSYPAAKRSDEAAKAEIARLAKERSDARAAARGVPPKEPKPPKPPKEPKPPKPRKTKPQENYVRCPCCNAFAPESTVNAFKEKYRVSSD
jgi:hypothetical protein